MLPLVRVGAAVSADVVTYVRPLSGLQCGTTLRAWLPPACSQGTPSSSFRAWWSHCCVDGGRSSRSGQPSCCCTFSTDLMFFSVDSLDRLLTDCRSVAELRREDSLVTYLAFVCLFV